MKILKQCAIIFSIAALGDFLSKYFKIPIPGNVVGMFILFVLLSVGIVKEKHISEVSDFLLRNLVFFFIPGSLAIVTEFSFLKGNLISFSIICILVVFIIIASTGMSANALEKIFKKHHDKKRGTL